MKADNSKYSPLYRLRDDKLDKEKSKMSFSFRSNPICIVRIFLLCICILLAHACHKQLRIHAEKRLRICDKCQNLMNRNNFFYIFLRLKFLFWHFSLAY